MDTQASREAEPALEIEAPAAEDIETDDDETGDIPGTERVSAETPEEVVDPRPSALFADIKPHRIEIPTVKETEMTNAPKRRGRPPLSAEEKAKRQKARTRAAKKGAPAAAQVPAKKRGRPAKGASPAVKSAPSGGSAFDTLLGLVTAQKHTVKEIAAAAEKLSALAGALR